MVVGGGGNSVLIAVLKFLFLVCLFVFYSALSATQEKESYRKIQDKITYYNIQIQIVQQGKSHAATTPYINLKSYPN